MDSSAFVIGMIVYGLIVRIQFIMRFGPGLNIDTDSINLDQKYFQSRLDSLVFIPYIAVVIWGFINMLWFHALLIMLGSLFLGGLLVTKGNFKHFAVVKVHFEFLIILICLYLWRKLLLK